MSHEKELRDFFARHLDFRPAERRELEEYFNSHARDSLQLNPLASEAVVDRWIGVGTNKVPLDVKDLITVFSSRVLTTAQKEHLLNVEQRAGSWSTYVMSQDVTLWDLQRLCALEVTAKQPSFSSTVLLHAAAHELDEATIATLFRTASMDSKLHFVAYAPVGSHADTTAATLPQLAKEKNLAKGPSHLASLVENRPDLYAALIAAGGIFLSPVAGSRHLTDSDLQRTLVGLDDARSLSRPALTRLYKKRWALTALVHNPVADLALVEELLAFFEQLEDEAQFAEVADACRSRLASGRPQVLVPFEEIEDPMILGWLVNRCAPLEGTTTTKRPYDTQALLANPHLNSRQRELLARADLTYLRKGITPMGPAMLALALERRAPTPAGEDSATASPTSHLIERLDVSVMSQSMDKILTSSHWRVFEEDLLAHLGTQPTAWSTFFGLSGGWTLSWDELVTTAAQLSQGLH